MQPLTFFTERIGKVVERSSHHVISENLIDEIQVKRILIRDDFHARYLHMIQCDYHADGVELNYRDHE